MSKTLIIIISIVGCAIVIGPFIYFVAGVSSTYPPIKTYDYHGTADQLNENLKKIAASNHNVSLGITDTTGNSENGYAYYFTIRFKNAARNIEYTIRYSKTDDKNTDNKSVLKLTEAYDITHNTGGYSEKANGVKELTGLFEKYILPKL